jgi:hypothetical protein
VNGKLGAQKEDEETSSEYDHYSGPLEAL